MIVIRRATIDNDVRNAALRGKERKRSRWINRQRGAERDDEIRCHRRFLGALERFRFEALSKTDRRRLEEAAAATDRCLAMFSKKFEVRLGVGPRSTVDAFDEEIGAV